MTLPVPQIACKSLPDGLEQIVQFALAAETRSAAARSVGVGETAFRR